MKRFFIIILLFSSFLSVAQQNSYPAFLTEFTQNKLVKNASVSLFVADKTGKELLSTMPQLCVTPASVLKLVTTATAIEMFGGDFKFKTIIWANGEVSNGILNGDLIITGGGDPTLGSEYLFKNGGKKKFLSEWVHLIKQAGIDSISGNIISDPSVYADQDVPQTWIWEDMGNYYGAAARGIAVYDNTFELIFNTSENVGGTTEVARTTPEIPGIELQNEVTSSSENRDNAYVFGSPYDSFRVIKGTLPRGRNGFAVKASTPDPALLLASELRKILADSSVFVSGNIENRKVISADKIDSTKIIIEWNSPSLAEIIEQLNHESVNLFAEHLCKHIGLAVKGVGSTNDGTAAIVEFWKSKEIDTENLFMADGCGLSRFNALTAKTLVEILNYMKQSKWYSAYEKSVPLTGLQGTQKFYFQNSILKGKARAKTGSMTRVRSFAGYMTTQSGTEISFAIMVNNFSGPSSNLLREMEKLMESIYKNL